MGPAKHLNEIRLNTGGSPGASRLEDFTNLGAVFLGNHVKNGTEKNPNEMPFKRDVYKAVWERTPEGAQGSSPWCRRRVWSPPGECARAGNGWEVRSEGGVPSCAEVMGQSLL